VLLRGGLCRPAPAVWAGEQSPVLRSKSPFIKEIAAG
jgi:hypothetical protein